MPRSMDHLPVGVPEAEYPAVVQSLVDGVLRDRLVEILRQATSRIPAGEGRSVRDAGGDAGAPLLQ